MNVWLQKTNPVRVSLLVIAALFIGAMGVQLANGQNISRVEGLKNVGPRDPVYGYPLWYEDSTGLKLKLCTVFTQCLIAPPNPGRVLSLPTIPNDPNANFPDETFFYAAESIMSGNNNIDKALLVQALEATFINEVPIDGDQVVFSRIRIRIDGLTDGETYTVTYPYGKQSFIAKANAGPGVAPSPGYTMTRDIGITTALEFTGAVKGDIGPFLVPVGYFGGPFISDAGGTLETVSGSPLGTNFFRIEGPNIGDAYPAIYHCADATLGPDPLLTNDCIENDQFSLMGQVATQMGVTAERATFSKIKDAAQMDQIHVNVWARSAAGQSLVASVDGGLLANMTEGMNGNYFARILVTQNPVNVRVSNISDTPLVSETIPVTDEILIKEASYRVGGGLFVSVQQSNQVDPGTMTASLNTGQAFPQEIPLTHLGKGLWEGVVPLDAATGSGAPYSVAVRSSQGGMAISDVVVSGDINNGGILNRLMANAGRDQSVLAGGATVILNGAGSVGIGTMTYAWTHDALPTQIVLTHANSIQPNFTTPTTAIPGGRLAVNFTLTVSEGLNASSDTLTVFITDPASLPVDQCSISGAIFSSAKQQWVVEGTCDLIQNQIIDVRLGDNLTPMNLIGTTRVDALGAWRVTTGSGSAVFDGTVPVTGTHTRVYANSSRGSNSSSPFSISR